MYGSITQFKGHLTFKGLYLEIELTLLFIENVYSNLLLIRKKKKKKKPHVIIRYKIALTSKGCSEHCRSYIACEILLSCESKRTWKNQKKLGHKRQQLF